MLWLLWSSSFIFHRHFCRVVRKAIDGSLVRVSKISWKTVGKQTRFSCLMPINRCLNKKNLCSALFCERKQWRWRIYIICRFLIFFTTSRTRTQGHQAIFSSHLALQLATRDHLGDLRVWWEGPTHSKTQQRQLAVRFWEGFRHETAL